MQSQTRWGLIIGAGVLAGLVLVACVLLVFAGLSPAILGRGFLRQYRSNGEQIYFIATSQRGTPITSDVGMGMMGGGRIACVNCHGPDGRGGRVRVMMSTFVAPDIRYRMLTAEEVEHEGEEAHPPYTDETIKRAITRGVDPAGNPLEWPMPRWTMTDEDLNDLLEFLKSLD